MRRWPRRRRLLLLDGAERIADQVAELAGDLLAAVPELRIVVTSRVVLGIPGEVCWTVPPLDCPSVAAGAADIAASDAVQLFIARASERLPDFRAADVAPHAIAELCRRLDGLPLAIELIAGWVGTLSIREILQQRAVLLDSEPAQLGQHSGRRLADVLQVSYDLLTPEQQRRLAMLSVLRRPVPDRRRAGRTRRGRAGRGRHHPVAGRLVLAGGHPRQRAEPVQHAGDHPDVRRAAAGAGPATDPRPGGGTRCTSPRSRPAASRDWPARTRPTGPRRLEAAVADLHAGAALGGRARRRRPRPGHQRGAVALVAGQRPARGRPELAGQVPDPGRRPREDERGRPRAAARPPCWPPRTATTPRRSGSAELAHGDLRPARPEAADDAGRHRARLGAPLPRQPRGRPARLPAGHGPARRARRPPRHVGRDQQHGAARAGRRQPRPRAASCSSRRWRSSASSASSGRSRSASPTWPTC